MGVFKDLTGMRYGKLSVVKKTEQRFHGQVVWECKCDCGNTCYAPSSSLEEGNTKSCGCLGFTDLTGKRFGKLTVVKASPKRRHAQVVWLCECDCGNTCEALSSSLLSGYKKSCGCLQRRKLDILNTEDLTDRRFGNLTAVKRTDSKNKSGYYIWECKCDCGNTCYVPVSNLGNGVTKSCGCGPSRAKPEILQLEGKRFGRLTAIKPTGKRSASCIVWECKCDCGNTCYVPATRLKAGITKSCGCLTKERNAERSVDITGKKFGKLVAIKPTNEVGREGRVWECRCECGETCYVTASLLMRGKTVSCGNKSCRKSTYKDLSGQRFGKLTVVRPTDERSNSCVVWECKCDCGNTCYVSSKNLTAGTTKSCKNCSNRLGSDLSGKRFGMLTAIRPTEQRDNGSVVWECKCDCGRTHYVSRKSLSQGRVISCECLNDNKG